MNKINSKLSNAKKYILFLSFVLILLGFHNIKTTKAWEWWWNLTTTTTTRPIPSGTVRIETDSTFINQGEAVIFSYEVPDFFSWNNIYMPCTLNKVNSDNSTSTIISFRIEQAKGTLCYSSWEMNGKHEVGGFKSCSGSYDQIKPTVDTKYQMECQVWQYKDYWWDFATKGKLLGSYKSNVIEVKVASLKLDIEPSFYFSEIHTLPMDVSLAWEGNHVNQCRAYTFDDPACTYPSNDNSVLTSGWSGEKPVSGTVTVKVNGYTPFSLICSKEGYSLDDCVTPICNFSCEDNFNREYNFSGNCSQNYSFGCSVHRIGTTRSTFYPGQQCSSIDYCRKGGVVCADVSLSNCTKTFANCNFNSAKCIRTEKNFTSGLPPVNTIAIYAAPTHIPYNGTSSIFILLSPSLLNADYGFQSSVPVPILDIKGGKYQKTIYITGNYWKGGMVEYVYYKIKPATDLIGLTFNKLNELSVCEAYDTDNEYPLYEDGSRIVALSWRGHSKKFDYRCRNSKSFAKLLAEGLGSYEYYTTLVPPWIEVSLTEDTTFLVEASVDQNILVETEYAGIPAGNASYTANSFTWDLYTYHYDSNGDIVNDTKIATLEATFGADGHITSTKIDGKETTVDWSVIPFDSSGNVINKLSWETASSQTTTNKIGTTVTIYVFKSNELQVSLSANPTTITKGATSTIEYNILNTSTSTPCVATSTDDIWQPVINLDDTGKASGSDTVTLNDVKTYDFSLTCYDKDGNPQTATAQVKVTEGGKYDCDSTKGCIESDSGTYTKAQCEAICKYHCTSADTCDLVYSANDSLKVCSTIADCVPPPPVCTVSIDANPKLIILGKSLTLTWEPENCDTCSAETYLKAPDETLTVTDKGGVWTGDPLEIISTNPKSPLNISHDTQVTPIDKGTFEYEITCNGESAETGATTDTESIEVKTITLPWWREIIPNLLPFLRGMIR